MAELFGFEMRAVGEPLTAVRRSAPVPGAGEVRIRVAGCGICHTDLGFLDDGVPTRHALPLILGHEISGVVEATGAGAESWLGKAVIVPAVMPCGACEICDSGRGSICPQQIFPGNDLDGGFADRVVVPALGICDAGDPAASGLDLAELSVIADAVTTPYQSILRSGLAEGDLAVFVGVGGVGVFGVQIARALGATVVAVDVDEAKLARAAAHGADLTLDARTIDGRAMKKTVAGVARERGLPRVGWKIFETSGTPSGQKTAFSLLVHGAYLGIVGFSPKPVEVPLSHLMAFDATAQGNWGCLPEHYPAVLDLVRKGMIEITPFVTKRPLAAVNEALDEVRRHATCERVVLIP